jgi:hypothetical protein
MSPSGSRSWPAVRRCTAAFVLFSLPAAPLKASDDRNVLLNRAVQRAEEKLRTCGPELYARFGVEAGSLRTITYAAGDNVRACRDLNTIVLGKVGEPLIVLCTPQFWRKVEQAEDEAADFLIHEYLHTRGLNEWPHGGKYDSVSITRIVKETCGRTRDLARSGS